MATVEDLPDYSALTLDDRPLSSSNSHMSSSEGPVASTSTAGMSQSTSSTSGEQFRSGANSLAAPPNGPARTNPLTDLIATERLYVDDLASVIKRVAAAWSRTNFPPPQLDSMFRAIESVYRINKALLGRLTDIGPSPSSPKLLGDLLMRWIDELEPAYTRYSGALTTTFDDDPAVQGNVKLGPILASLPAISSARPGTPQPVEEGPVTIDRLFILPFYRLRYYKKLYSKLLKSTQPGRSDHRLLVGANEKLDALIALCDDSLAQAKEKELPPIQDTTPVARQSQSMPPRPNESPALPPPPREASPVIVESPASSSRVVSTASSSSLGRYEPRRSSLAASVTQSMASTTTPSLSNSVASDLSTIDVAELERRLDTARTLDIFTMKPKKCRLQMQPPTLGYARTIRQAGEVALRFQPASEPNGREVSIRRAFLILLTDLFLVCEPVAPAERHEATPGADLWLLFPPLSGKHLRVDVVEGDELAFEISIMRKEHLQIRCDSKASVAQWIDSFDECCAFGNNALRIKTESPSGRSATSPTVPTPNGLRNPLSPSESSMSGFSDRLPPPRAFSTASDPVGMRSRSADPEYMPPPPRPANGNGYSPVDVYPPGRRSSEGSHMQQHPQYRAPQSPSLGGQYPMPPPPMPGPSGSYGMPMGPPPGAGQYNGHHDSMRPTSSIRSTATSNLSRRTDPGLGAMGPQYGSQPVIHSQLGPSHQQAMHRSKSADGLRSAPGLRTNGLHAAPMPIDRHYRAPSTVSPIKAPADPEDEEEDEVMEAERERASMGPIKSQLAASMRCKVFLQQGRMQWKAVGTAKLRLYLQSPTNVKQLVVEQGDGGKAKPIISTIVLTDGVERVGKTGVAIELSDKGERTGIVYMLQMKTEQSATGLFSQLLLGSDRTSRPA